MNNDVFKASKNGGVVFGRAYEVKRMTRTLSFTLADSVYLIDGDGYRCNTASGAGFDIEWVFNNFKMTFSYFWKTSKGYMSGLESGWSDTRAEAIDSACASLVDAGFDLDNLPHCEYEGLPGWTLTLSSKEYGRMGILKLGAHEYDLAVTLGDNWLLNGVDFDSEDLDYEELTYKGLTYKQQLEVLRSGGGAK